MSRMADNRRSAAQGFSFSLNEFRAEWEILKLNVDKFLSDVDSGNDIDSSGTSVKMSSSRLSFLSAEIIAFTASDIFIYVAGVSSHKSFNFFPSGE